VRDGLDCRDGQGEAKVESYGSRTDEDLLEEHYVKIFEFGNTRVNIEMTRGKARVYVETARE
jgi:hypothetical protein